jgi:ribonuclease P protein component
MADSRFPKTLRLLKTADFDRVFARRRSQADGVLLLYGCENGLGVPRLGLVVSRKCGKSVARNQWKRTIREAFRISQHDLPPGVDLVVLPKAATPPPMLRVQQSLLALSWQAARRLRVRDARAPGAGEAP